MTDAPKQDNQMSRVQIKRVDLVKIAEQTRADTMASLGLRQIALPFQAVDSGKCYEWETTCDTCGIRLLYLAYEDAPPITTCDRCRREGE